MKHVSHLHRNLTWTLCVGLFSLAAVAPAGAVELEEGDRIVFIGDTFADQLRTHGYAETQLMLRRPDLELTCRVMGWPGDTLSKRPRPLNFGSLDEHLKQQRADVIVACFGMSASLDDPHGAQNFGRNLGSFVDHLRARKYNGQSPPRIVLVSPIAREPVAPRSGFEAHQQALEAYTAAIRTVADDRETAFVDLLATTSKLQEESSSPRLTKNGIHLNGYGYWAVSHALADGIAGPAPSWRIEVETGRDEVLSPAPEESTDGGRPIRISDIESGDRGVRFKLRTDALPAPAPPKGLAPHPRLADRLPQLVVRALRPGTYVLEIDGTRVHTADDRQWARGVVLCDLPARDRTAELREAIQRKNEWFFYRWRPANAEYVFGRRTKPFGAVSFPPEMEQFDALITEEDRRIHRLSQSRRTETWRLVRVER